MVTSFGFLPPAPHTPPLERRTSRSSARSAASAASERSPVKSIAGHGSPSPTRSVRSLRRVASGEGGDKAETPTSTPLLAPTPVAPERRLSVRLKRAALSPKPRPLTGEPGEPGEPEAEKEDGGKGARSPRLVAAALESVGW